MTTKVDLNIDLKKIRKAVIKSARAKMSKVLQKSIVELNIKKGISPVRGKWKFEAYSPSYKSAINSGRFANKKSVRPVNLMLDGDLLDSFYVDASADGFTIGFDNDLADIHNRLGAGKIKTVRRMLPTNHDEKFNRSIMKIVEMELNIIINEVLRRRPRS